MEKLINKIASKEAEDLVFLFFMCVTIVVFMIILIFSKIRIEIINFQFCSQLKRHINKDYEIVIKLCAFDLLPIFKLKLTKEKLEKMKVKEKIKKIDFTALESNVTFDKESFRQIKKLDISIEKINLHIDLGTENASLTAILVPAISTIIAIILRKNVKKFENQIFIMKPIYQNQNLVNLFISGIFEIKMSHIINIMYYFAKKEKKGVKKYERTSNRGAYDYGYE